MTCSFLHSGDRTMASYRYRALRPADAIGAALNDSTADVLIFAKPCPADVARLQQANHEGRRTIVDVCDIHWHAPSQGWMRTMLHEATAVTANTDYTAQLLQEDLGRQATVIPDPYGTEAQPAHCTGAKLLWFGHPSNVSSINRLLSLGELFPLTIVTDAAKVDGPQTVRLVPWSEEALRQELALADIVLMPETAPHKSANRTLEAIQAGCYVVAEPHPSLRSFPDLPLGNIRKGIVWAQEHLPEANARTTRLQQYVQAQYSLERVGNAWKSLVQGCTSTSVPARSRGLAGSMSMPTGARVLPMCVPT
jgi:hypothetical protein